MQFVKKVKPASSIRFIWVHSLSSCIAIPHPPQCAHWGTFPSGEGIFPSRWCAKLQFTVVGIENQSVYKKTRA